MPAKVSHALMKRNSKYAEIFDFHSAMYKTWSCTLGQREREERCKRPCFYLEVIIADPVWLLERTMIGSWEILALDYAIKLIWFVQAGFRKGRGTGDQIANIHWIMEKSKRVTEKHQYSSVQSLSCVRLLTHIYGI